MTVVIARTRHVYDSYGDFFRLVEASQLPTCYVDEIDLASENTYIFTPMNGEMMGRLDHLTDRRCKIIWWNLERSADETLQSSLDKLSGKIDGIWVSDRGYAALDWRFMYVPIAGHPAFGTRATHRIYDVCPLAYLWGRRESAIRHLQSIGIKVAGEAYGRAMQDKVVAQSHLVLNMHQYEVTKTVAPLRFAVAASYAVPIVSEPFDDKQAEGQVILAAPIPKLTAAIPQLLKYPDMLAAQGEALHRKLCITTDFWREVMIASGKVGT